MSFFRSILLNSLILLFSAPAPVNVNEAALVRLQLCAYYLHLAGVKKKQCQNSTATVQNTSHRLDTFEFIGDQLMVFDIYFY